MVGYWHLADVGSSDITFQQVSDFGEELYLSRRFGRGRGRLFLLQFVHTLDDQEQSGCDDEKIQSDGQKLTPAEHRAFFFGIRIRWRCLSLDALAVDHA